MIDLGHPLGHADVISVFCFECELKETPGDPFEKTISVSAETTVRRNRLENRVSVRDQPKANVTGREVRARRAVKHPHEVIVEERGPQRELRLL